VPDRRHAAHRAVARHRHHPQSQSAAPDHRARTVRIVNRARVRARKETQSGNDLVALPLTNTSTSTTPGFAPPPQIAMTRRYKILRRRPVMRRFALVITLSVAVCAASMARAEGTNTMVLMSTSMGDIKIELNAEKAPETVKNFLGYVNDKFFDGTIFHRVIPNFMIQIGRASCRERV